MVMIPRFRGNNAFPASVVWRSALLRPGRLAHPSSGAPPFIGRDAQPASQPAELHTHRVGANQQEKKKKTVLTVVL